MTVEFWDLSTPTWLCLPLGNSFCWNIFFFFWKGEVSICFIYSYRAVESFYSWTVTCNDNTILIIIKRFNYAAVTIPSTLHRLYYSFLTAILIEGSILTPILWIRKLEIQVVTSKDLDLVQGHRAVKWGTWIWTKTPNSCRRRQRYF